MSVFYNKILNWAKKGDSLVTANGNNLICLVHKNIKDDYLHVLFYPLDKKKQKQFEEDYQIKKNKHLSDYFDFIAEHNGSVLYSGAIVFFGFTDSRSINTFVEPPSLVRMNETDRFVRDNPSYLFIGNLMHHDMDNVNIYFNVTTGYILWIHKGEISKEFTSLVKMLEFIINYYEPHDKSDGENVEYDNIKKNVYENIQLF